MVDNGVVKPHIRCGCGEWFSEFEAFQRHRNEPGHLDLGEMYVPNEVYHGN